MSIRIIAPTEWGARVDYTTWAENPRRRERVALHYNGGPISNYDRGRRFEEAALRSIESYHIDKRGWRGIGYGYAIGASGTIYRLRGRATLGAHKGDYDLDGIAENEETHAILLILGQGQPMTDPMRTSIAGLRLELETAGGAELVLIGHQEIAQQGTGTVTACPGDLVMDYVRANRRLGSTAPAGEPIMGRATTTPAEAHMWASGKNAAQVFLEVIPLYYDVFPTYGVRPEVGVVQAFHETGGGRFGRAVTPAHHNWCGLKVTRPTGADDDPDSHARFPSDRHGIIAHAEHLRLYADRPTPNAVDPRHFAWLAGTATTVRSLGGKWAPSKTYGERLEQLLRELTTGADLWPDGLEPYFRDSWKWAADQGIVSDSSMPDAPVTDERLMEFLHRALAADV